MAKIFTIENPANPIRLVSIKTPNQGKYFYQGFDDNLSSQLIPNFQLKKCYYQKYTTQDKPKLQVLSDYTNIFCKLYDIHTNELVETYTWVEITTQILNQTFKCYEAEIDFTIVPDGDYQLVVYYYDTDPMDLVYFYSEPIQIKDVHENTILIEYTNSVNNFSLIFDNQFKGLLRVEAAILNFKASSDDVIYEDQQRNSTTIYSLPFKQYQFFLGSAEGVPDWMVDRVNRAFSFDILSLDGVFYNKLEGAKFEEKRAENYPYSGQVLDIIPIENRFQDKINTDNLVPINEDMIQYQKVLKYIANGDDILIENKFKNGTILEKILIVNRSIDFDLQVLTTTSGDADDIDLTVTIEGITATILINQLFSQDKSLRLIGLDTYDTDVYVLYKDLLAVPSGTPNAYFTLGVGAVVIYEEKEPGFKDIDFNFATGLGREDTEWFGWAICDGRNGTKNRGGLLPYGFLDGDVIFENIDQEIGDNEFTLTESNIPKHHFKMFTTAVNSTAGDSPDANNQVARAGTGGSADLRYELRKSTLDATIGKTSSFGGDIDGNTNPVEILQKGIVSLFVKKIAN